MPDVAVPDADATSAPIVKLLGPESVADIEHVADPPVPSVVAQSDSRRTGCGSSSVIVTVDCPSPSVAPLGEDSVTRNVSLGSSRTSPTTDSGTALERLPGGNVTTPLAAV